MQANKADMTTSPQKEKVIDKVRKTITYFLKLKESDQEDFKISGFFSKEFIREILSSAGNTITLGEYIEISLSILNTYVSKKPNDYTVQIELEKFIKKLQVQAKKNIIQRERSIASESEKLSTLVLKSYDKLVLEEEPIEEEESQLPQYAGNGHKVIWTIASGKGGTGKSLMAANIAIGMAVMGYKVILVDADLGMPNLHNHLHIKRPDLSLDDFFSQRFKNLTNVIVQTPLENLRFIHGASNLAEIANVQYEKKIQLINQIFNLQADVILVDIGAGTTNNVVDLFNISKRGILVSNPEPNAVQDAYFFLKNVFYRRIKLFCKENAPFKDMLTDYFGYMGANKLEIPKLQMYLNSKNPVLKAKFDRFLTDFRPRLIMNKVHFASQMEESERLVNMVSSFMNIYLDHLGDVKFDTDLIEFADGIRPYMCDNPNNKITKSLFSIFKKLEDQDLSNYTESSFPDFRSSLNKFKQNWDK